MRITPFLLSLGASACMVSTAFAGDKSYSVELNKTELVRLPAAASAVVIGNPKIADVSVHSADTLFVVGRGFGETNLLVLDASGRTMMNADIQVVHTMPHEGVRLFNAKSRETYNCQPYCQPSPVLGDNTDFIANNSAEGDPVDPLTALFNAAAAQASSQGGGSNGTGPAQSDGSTFGGGPN